MYVWVPNMPIYNKLNTGIFNELFGKKIDTVKKDFADIDTVTLYLSEKFQQEYYDYILSLHPKRVIFNPGTENPEFEELLKENHIDPVENCTLVLLSTGQYWTGK